MMQQNGLEPLIIPLLEAVPLTSDYSPMRAQKKLLSSEIFSPLSWLVGNKASFDSSRSYESMLSIALCKILLRTRQMDLKQTASDKVIDPQAILASPRAKAELSRYSQVQSDVIGIFKTDHLLSFFGWLLCDRTELYLADMMLKGKADMKPACKILARMQMASSVNATMTTLKLRQMELSLIGVPARGKSISIHVHLQCL